MGGARFVGMRNVRMWFSLVGLSIVALLILRYFPGNWLNDDYHLNSIVGYLLVAAIFYCAIYVLGLPTLQYFGLPKIRIKAIVAVALAFPAPVLQILDADLIYSSWLDVIGGVVFLFMIGFGEEMLSRGFTYGVLLKYGRYKAIFFSSLLFGLLHINVYIPGHLGWDTYYHVMSTWSFGMIMCALMIVTRSIWVPVIFHALMDWHIPFQNDDPAVDDSTVYSLWGNLTGPFFSFAFDLGIVALLLAVEAARMPRIPKWALRLAIKWKLVEPEADKYALVGEN